jgi:hypothetical protein
VNGKIVVPMVQITEAFAAACRDFKPKLNLLRLNDIQVLQAARVHDIDSGEMFLIKVRQQFGGTSVGISLELINGTGKSLYRALAKMGTLPLNEVEAPERLHGESKQGVYGGVLFHGPEFQVLSDVNVLSEQGAEASLVAKGWSQSIPAQDAALQLALLWTEQKLKRKSLPMSISSIDYFSSSLATNCRLIGRDVKDKSTQSDAYLFDNQGRVTTIFQGITTVVYGED